MIQTMTRILVAGTPNLITPEGRVILEAKGYQVLLSSNLHDALALVFDDPPDLLITEKGFEDNGDIELINAVKACLQKANIPVILVLPEQRVVTGIDWNTFPVDDIVIQPVSPEILLARVQLAESRMHRVFDNNPLSRLPGNTSIIRAINNILQSDEQFGVCYVDIDNFKPYNDRYGFSRGDEVILMVARILVNVIEEMARDNSFVGHVGGDDYVFIVKSDKVKDVCERILENFDLVRNMFLSQEDLDAGEFIGKDRQNRETRFGLLSLSLAVVTTGKDKYRHYGEVSVAASQIKQYVKGLEGSNYMIDRRK